MKNLRFWSLAGVLGVTVLAAVVWLAPAAHGQAKRQYVVQGTPETRKDTMEAQVAVPVERELEVLMGNRGSRIGVAIRDLSDVDLKAGKSGVVVDEVRENTPAATSGMKNGDVVTAFDGERVRSARQFARLVEETPAGRAVKAQVLRDGKPVDLTVTPAPADERAADVLRRFEWRGDREAPAFRMTVPEIPEIPHGEFGPGGNFDVRIWARPGRLGVSVQSLTPELAEYFGVKEGVLVTSVTKDSAASKAGIKAGDVITAVDGKPVDDAGELRRQLRTDDDKAAEVTLGVVRDRKTMSMTVPLAGEAKPEPKRPRRTV